MTSGDEGKLFAGLPEHPAPERTYQDKPRLRMAERRQVELRPVALDDLVPEDHRVRMVWRFVEGLDLAAFYATIRARDGRAGRPPRLRSCASGCASRKWRHADSVACQICSGSCSTSWCRASCAARRAC